MTTPDRITLPIPNGLHAVISKAADSRRLIVRVIKKPRKQGYLPSSDQDVSLFVSEPDPLTMVQRDYRGVFELYVTGFSLSLTDTSAAKAAAFLGVALDDGAST
ncbi:hypothetical protein ACQKIE_18600 [Luteibacter sp. NPDC031894]|uniref:hypothetical protein n=1 Tax=Luteibacter sp. NPDC031894 TaxID=3390572 RepID=UPI003CFE291B